MILHRYKTIQSRRTASAVQIHIFRELLIGTTVPNSLHIIRTCRQLCGVTARWRKVWASTLDEHDVPRTGRPIGCGSMLEGGKWRGSGRVMAFLQCFRAQLSSCVLTAMGGMTAGTARCCGISSELQVLTAASLSVPPLASTEKSKPAIYSKPGYCGSLQDLTLSVCELHESQTDFSHYH